MAAYHRDPIAVPVGGPTTATPEFGASPRATLAAPEWRLGRHEPQADDPAALRPGPEPRNGTGVPLAQSGETRRSAKGIGATRRPGGTATAEPGTPEFWGNTWCTSAGCGLATTEIPEGCSWIVRPRVALRLIVIPGCAACVDSSISASFHRAAYRRRCWGTFLPYGRQQT